MNEEYVVIYNNQARKCDKQTILYCIHNAILEYLDNNHINEYEFLDNMEYTSFMDIAMDILNETELPLYDEHGNPVIQVYKLVE